MNYEGSAKVVVLLLALLVGFGGLLYFKYSPGLKPAVTNPPKKVKNKKPEIKNKEDKTKEKKSPSSKQETESKTKEVLKEGINRTNIPLEVPRGFKIEVLTNKVPQARDIEVGPRGNLWLSRTDEGTLTMIDLYQGRADEVKDIFSNLNNPHGLAFHPEDNFTLYIAEEDEISKVTVYSEKSSMEKVVDLPPGGRHYTRSLEFGADGNLYVSIGSTCDVCFESNPKHGSIQKVNLKTKELIPYASGLRNAVFFKLNPFDKRLWATEMGRDHLGDNLPPDEINIVKKGADYGWPVCYGDNTYDKKFDGKPRDDNPCRDKESSYIDLQAHVAPLGLDFIPKEGWPEKYQNNMIVAYHGSWNRTVPVGYKLKRIKLDKQGNPEGREDFISGWLAKDGSSFGRPVDVEILPGGVMYVTDDKAGVVYKVTYTPQDSPSVLSSQIRITNLNSGQQVKSNFMVKGEAKGFWFFEGSFSIKVMDSSGNQLTTVNAKAQKEWMTEDFVPFRTQVDVSDFKGRSIVLEFKKANPSGLDKNKTSLKLPLRIDK